MPDDVYFGDASVEEAFASESSPAPEQKAEVAVSDVDAASSFDRRIVAVQRRLKAPKSQFNSFGGYAYRSCEDILEGLKPLLEENDLLMTIDDDIVYIEGRFYVKATVTVRDVISGLSRSASAFAREPENRKGSDQSQVTGSCSSYARKFALNALWLIDDTKDADADQPKQQKPKEPPVGEQFTAHCKSCGTRYAFTDADYYRQFIQNPGCCQSPSWEVE